MEIIENQPNEKSKDYLFRACSSKGICLHYLCFCRDSKASRGVGKLYKWEKWMALVMA